VQNAYHAVSIDEQRRPFIPTLWTNPDGSDRINDAQVEQVWFAGAHCDVGGSYEPGDLADIPLAWMMRNAMACGLAFTPQAMAKYLPPNPAKATAPTHDEWKLLPWGIPKRRDIPPRSSIANSVVLRLGKCASYRPRNLTQVDGKPQGYGITDVLS